MFCFHFKREDSMKSQRWKLTMFSLWWDFILLLNFAGARKKNCVAHTESESPMMCCLWVASCAGRIVWNSKRQAQSTHPFFSATIISLHLSELPHARADTCTWFTLFEVDCACSRCTIWTETGSQLYESHQSFLVIIMLTNDWICTASLCHPLVYFICAVTTHRRKMIKKQ